MHRFPLFLLAITLMTLAAGCAHRTIAKKCNPVAGSEKEEFVCSCESIWDCR